MLLNCGDQTRTGAFSMVWPLAKIERHFHLIFTDTQSFISYRNRPSFRSKNSHSPHHCADISFLREYCWPRSERKKKQSFSYFSKVNKRQLLCIPILFERYSTRIRKLVLFLVYGKNPPNPPFIASFKKKKKKKKKKSPGLYNEWPL